MTANVDASVDEIIACIDTKLPYHRQSNANGLGGVRNRTLNGMHSDTRNKLLELLQSGEEQLCAALIEAIDRSSSSSSKRVGSRLLAAYIDTLPETIKLNQIASQNDYDHYMSALDVIGVVLSQLKMGDDYETEDSDLIVAACLGMLMGVHRSRYPHQHAYHVEVEYLRVNVQRGMELAEVLNVLSSVFLLKQASELMDAAEYAHASKLGWECTVALMKERNSADTEVLNRIINSEVPALAEGTL